MEIGVLGVAGFFLLKTTNGDFCIEAILGASLESPILRREKAKF